MLRRTCLTAFAALTVGLVSLAHAAQEGVDYVELEKPIPNAQNTLAKIWSYACPFCYKFDKSVDPIILPKVEAASHLKYLPLHLESKGEQGRTASLVMAALALDDAAHHRALTSPDSLFHKAKAELYEQYHKMHTRWATEDDFLNTVASATGLSVASLKTMMAQPAAIKLADDWKVTYDIAKIQGVPAYIVNGKYLIMTKAIRSPDGMVNLINELAQLPQ